MTDELCNQHSFPTRRSSDLADPIEFVVAPENQGAFWIDLAPDGCTIYYTSYGPNVKRFDVCAGVQDRKSTRLNSSHGYISYAVFCLKKIILSIKHRTVGRDH